VAENGPISPQPVLSQRGRKWLNLPSTRPEPAWQKMAQSPLNLSWASVAENGSISPQPVLSQRGRKWLNLPSTCPEPAWQKMAQSPLNPSWASVAENGSISPQPVDIEEEGPTKPRRSSYQGQIWFIQKGRQEDWKWTLDPEKSIPKMNNTD